MAKKGAMPTYKTADDYITAQAPESQTMLKEIRALILEAAPHAQELINCKVPSYLLVENGKRDQQIMMAAYAKFIGFYPFPTTMEAFAEDLKDYKQGKGSVQFPFDKPLPKELIKKMVKYRKEELENSSN